MMVTFDGYQFPHVLSVATESQRMIIDRSIPGASVGHRRDQASGGRIIRISGEIRRDANHALRIEEMRRRADDTARNLNLEDGSDPINAKLGTIVISWNVDDGTDSPCYSVTFYETS